MTTTEIIEAASAAHAGAHRLRLEGYTDSSGEKSNLEVELIGATGYRQLLEDSLDEVGEIERYPEVSSTDWALAVTQLCDSWRKSLAQAPGSGHSGSLEWDKRGFYFKPGDTETVALLHMRRLFQQVLEAPEKRGVTHRNEVTRVKALLRDRCSVGKYIGQVNLRPGKVERVTALGSVAVRL